MYKVYGFREEDVKDLAIFIKENRFKTLTETFKAYAEKNDRAVGSVRNLYYALTKTAKADAEFCEKYLDGKPIKVGEIKEFSDNEETALLENVFEGLKKGDSVRKIINDIAENNSKTALRLQNKYRSLIKNKPEKVRAAAEKIGIEPKSVKCAKSDIKSVSPFLEARLKREIDKLIARLTLKAETENMRLKERVAYLEAENRTLHRKLREDRGVDVLKYFSPSKTDLVN